jgi:hypothetical protein
MIDASGLRPLDVGGADGAAGGGSLGADASTGIE